MRQSSLLARLVTTVTRLASSGKASFLVPELLVGTAIKVLNYVDILKMGLAHQIAHRILITFTFYIHFLV